MQENLTDRFFKSINLKSMGTLQSYTTYTQISNGLTIHRMFQHL